MNKFPKDLFSIFKGALGIYKRRTIPSSLLTLLYIVLLILSSFWVLFLLFNYPLKGLTVGAAFGFLRILMILLTKDGNMLLTVFNVVGGIAVAFSFVVSIVYDRYLYINTQNIGDKNADTIPMPFSVFISALLTDVFLMLVSVVGLVFLIVPSFILTVRYKFVRLALISSEKTGFSKLVEVPNAFANSAKIVDGRNTVSTFCYLLAIFVVKHSALIILAFVMFIVGYFVPGILGGGVSAIVLWSVIVLWYIVFMAIGTYMYILLYLGLSESSSYGQNIEAASISPQSVDTDSKDNVSVEQTDDSTQNGDNGEDVNTSDNSSIMEENANNTNDTEDTGK